MQNIQIKKIKKIETSKQIKIEAFAYLNDSEFNYIVPATVIINKNKMRLEVECKLWDHTKWNFLIRQIIESSKFKIHQLIDSEFEEKISIQ